MARLPVEHNLTTPNSRARLKSRAEPYWRQIIAGTFLGYRKGARASAWVVRQRTPAGYAEQRLGTPDDALRPDGVVVLTYNQAVSRAQLVQVEARAPVSPRHYGDGLTLDAVLDYYMENHLAGKGSETITRGVLARHVRGSLGAKLVTALDADTLRRWHKALALKAPARRAPNPSAKRKGKSEADPARQVVASYCPSNSQWSVRNIYPSGIGHRLAPEIAVVSSLGHGHGHALLALNRLKKASRRMAAGRSAPEFPTDSPRTT